MKIEITEDERELMLEQATNIVLYGRGGDEEGGHRNGLVKEINRRVEAKFDQIAADAFKEAVNTEATARIQAILDEGWQETSTWGEKTGKRVTIREMIVEKLGEKVGQGYDRPGKSLIRHLVGEAVKGALGKELAAELEKAKNEIRDAVDGLIKEKLTETLRAALGLR